MPGLLLLSLLHQSYPHTTPSFPHRKTMLSYWITPTAILQKDLVRTRNTGLRRILSLLSLLSNFISARTSASHVELLEQGQDCLLSRSQTQTTNHTQSVRMAGRTKYRRSRHWLNQKKIYILHRRRTQYRTNKRPRCYRSGHPLIPAKKKRNRTRKGKHEKIKTDEIEDGTDQKGIY